MIASFKLPILESDGRVDRHFRTEHLQAELKGRSLRGGAIVLGSQAANFILHFSLSVRIMHEQISMLFCIDIACRFYYLRF